MPAPSSTSWPRRERVRTRSPVPRRRTGRPRGGQGVGSLRGGRRAGDPLRCPRQRHVALRAGSRRQHRRAAGTTAPDCRVRMAGRVRCPSMDVGDVVDDFELPDETGTPRPLSGLLAERPGGALLLPGGDDHRLHAGELPFPRPRGRVRRRRRPSGSGSAATRSTSSTSSPTSTTSTTRCSPTRTATSPG